MTATDTFKTEITEAIGAHGAWKFKLQVGAKSGKLDARSADLARDDVCRFGKWLGSIAAQHGGSTDFKAVQRLHAQFHHEAGDIAAKIERGDTDGAAAALSDGPLVPTSKQLVRALTAWKSNLL